MVICYSNKTIVTTDTYSDSPQYSSYWARQGSQAAKTADEEPRPRKVKEFAPGHTASE